MVKRWITILFLLAFSALPAAAQIYQAAEVICGMVSPADGDDEMMECCRIAGQCKMMEMSQEASVNECAMQCVCDSREPLLSIGVLTHAPQLPQADDTIIPQVPWTSWGKSLSRNSQTRFWLPPKTSLTNFRPTCLRI